MRTKVVLLLSTGILVTALVWLVVQPSAEPLVAALAALVGILSQVKEHERPAEAARAAVAVPEAQERSLLVMPLANLSPDSENEYFSDGLTEELIAALAHVPSLRVISRHSTMRLKGTEKSLGELARELSVDFVVEGGVRKVGTEIRITVHLVDAGRDTELWSQKYDGTLDDVFKFQEAVADAIVGALHLRFGPKHVGRPKAPSDPRAFDAYLRGRHEMGNWTREASENAHRFFSAGLDVLGENALLHAGLGHASFRLAHIVPGAMADYMKEAAASALRALDLDPDLVTAHVLSGLVDWKKGSIGSALRHFLDALESDPDDADALTWAVFCFAEVGHLGFIDDHISRLTLVDPLNSFTRFTEGFARLMGGDPAEASKAFAKSLSLDPTSTNTIALAAFTDARLGDTEAARVRLRNMLRLARDDVWTHLGVALLAALDGTRLTLPEHVVSDSRKDETFAWFIAECYAILKNGPEVIEWLDTALPWGFTNVAYLTSPTTAVGTVWNDPAFRTWTVRAESRRRQVLSMAGLSPV